MKVVIGNAEIYCGDCADVLRELGDACATSIITDPPAGISFMGKDWDGAKGGRNQWIRWMQGIAAECMRLVPPGGHALVWAIPRTSHWTATAWEDAEWECRDRIAHCFSTGFPKSADVSKSIDREAGAEREVVGKRSKLQSYGANNVYGNGPDKYGEQIITAPATDHAKHWQGYGTALKPAIEDYWLLRKPVRGTIASNVLEFGVGALNIDGCRIESGSPSPILEDRRNTRSDDERNAYAKGLAGSKAVGETSLGRFPAHLIHDGSDEVVALFPQSNGQLAAVGPQHGEKSSVNAYGDYGARHTFAPRNDKGSAARFFYCSKASRSDRGLGNDHPTVKSTDLMSYLIKLITPHVGVVLDPFMGSGSTGVAAVRLGHRFIGIEQDPHYFEIACRRLEEEQEQMEMFA